MTDDTPDLSLSYAPGEVRRDSVFGIVGLALGLLCTTVPVVMAWQVLRGTRTRFNVYRPYAGDLGIIDFKVNWPWYALDTLAILLGIVGIHLGRPRFGAAAVAVGVINLIGIMTLVLGSPW